MEKEIQAVALLSVVELFFTGYLQVSMDTLLDFPCCKDALHLPVVVNLALLHGMQSSKSGLRSTVFILCADDVKKYLLSEWLC